MKDVPDELPFLEMNQGRTGRDPELEQKSGGSLSFGPRGAKFTIGLRGKRATVGIPGNWSFLHDHAYGREVKW